VSVYWQDGVRPGSTSPTEPERGDEGSARLASTSEFLFRMADSLTRTSLEPGSDNARFGFNILIAGGQASDSLMLERLFTGLGYNTLLRHNGARALAAARRQPLDLVILDLELKDLDGMELLRAMKERDPYLPVVVLAERQNLQSAITAVRQGADDYILKPFGVDEIRASVDTAFSKRIRIMKERQDGSPRDSSLTLDVEHIGDRARQEFAAGARDLRLLEEFNRRSIENLMHGVLLLDSTLRVVHLNRLAMEMTGVGKTEGEPLPLVRLAPTLAEPRLLAALDQVLAGTEEVVINDLWLQGPDGGPRGLHKVLVQRTPIAEGDYLLVQLENILDSRLLQEETRKVRMQVARQIYGRVAQHLQVIAGRGELLQQRSAAGGTSLPRADLQQILDSTREIGRILTELGTDMNSSEG
jgi:DNA-binding response OmpR family regulator